MRGFTKKIFACAALGAVVLALGLASLSGCGGGTDTFTVRKAGDRMEVNLGTTGPATFHFEVKGFTDVYRSNDDGEWQYGFFWIYNGDNFYYKGTGEGFLYIPYQYAYNDYWCNYGKVKGRSDNPGPWPLEACYMTDPWDPDKWYTFDVDWDGSTITLSVDGVVKHTGTLAPASRNLVAGLGWPPEEHDGLIGMEFRNWSFKKK